MLSLRNLKTKFNMKHELDRMMSIIKDYETGFGGVTDSFLRKELEMFAKDYHKEQCNIADVMVSSFDRFGAGIKKYGYESEFRKECESLLKQLRHDELLTINLK